MTLIEMKDLIKNGPKDTDCPKSANTWHSDEFFTLGGKCKFCGEVSKK